MIMTTRKLMRFMPEAKQLDGNIWTWIVPIWDAFSEFRMNRYRSVKEKILVYSFGYSVAMIYSEYLSVLNGTRPHKEELYIVPNFDDVISEDDCYRQHVSPDTETADFTEYLITNGEEYDEIFDLIISMLGVDKVFAMLSKAHKGSAAGAFDATADNLSVYEWLKSRLE